MTAVPAQHPSHSSIVFWLAMNRFSVTIPLLLFCFKICTAILIQRNPIVGRLIETKSGNLFLQHSNKAKKGNQLIQESLQAAAAGRHGYSGKNMQHTKGRVQKPESLNSSARGYPPSPPLNGRENLAKKVNGKGGNPPPHSGRNFF